MFFGQDLYYRLNPQLRYNEEYDPLPQLITLDPEYTPIVIEINDPNVDFFYTNPNMVNMMVSQFSMIQLNNATPITNTVNYQMEICRPDHFDKLDAYTRQYFLNMNLQDYFCIPKDIKNLTMQGAFDQNYFQEIQFTISLCDNSTTNGTCLPIDQIKQNMSRGNIGIYFVDYNIDPGNYQNPISNQPKEVFTNFLTDSQKEIDIYFINNYIETDDGIMLQSSNQKIISTFDSFTVMDLQQEDPDFIYVYLQIKQRNAYYRRTYTKIQQVLAQIGGFINCFWIIAFSISHLHAKLLVVSEIIMNVFRIKLFFNNNNFSSRKNIGSVRTRNLPYV